MDKALALVLFPSLSSLAYTLLNPNLLAIRPVLREQCQSSSPSVNYLPVTGNDGFDRFLCVLVSLFDIGLQPERTLFLKYFFATWIPAATLFMSVESSRKGRRFVVSYSALVSGMLGQLLTFAVVLPLYWLYFVLVGRHNTGKVAQGHAEATLFGVFIGWITPSLALFTMPDPGVTAIFQIAPILAFVAQIGHLLARPSTTHSASGFRTVQAAYIASFVVASSIHLNTLAKFVSTDEFWAFFIPTLFAKDVNAAVMNVFQVDFLVMSLTWAFGSLWFARDVRDVVMLALWSVVGSLLVGPGAAFAGAVLWRESRLEAARLQQEKSKSS
ncbi:hypothetical protein BDZ89DRAFT_425242 [Hymenopellis radicata]|nr:hypothetical protein BDZ89DRAFT_425242 [Hymenopellis radicata]